MLARHPALRSRFRFDSARRIVEYRTDAEPAIAGLIDAEADGWAGADLRRLIEVLCYTPFDLADEPPARAEVVRIDASVTLLVLTVHHIVFDATSRQIVIDEIVAFYREAIGFAAAPALDVPVHPSVLQRPIPDEELATHVDAAVERLSGAPTTVDLPYDVAPHAELSMLGAFAGTTIDPVVTDGVSRAAARAGCTPFMTGVALLAGTLARIGKQRDFLFSVVWPGRDDPASAGVVGMFMSTLVLRVDLTAETTWQELLGTARIAAMETFIDADVPLDVLAARLDNNRDIARLPLTPILVNMANEPGPVDLAPGVRGVHLPLHPRYSKWDLALFVHLAEDAGSTRFELSLDYPRELFQDRTITDLLAALVRSAADLAHDPEEAVLESVNAAVDLDDPQARLELVRSVWREALGSDDFADDVSFFDVGGDSLRLIVLVERLRKESGRMIKTVDLFRAGTVRGHADLLVAVEAPADAPAARSSRSRLLDAARSTDK